MILKPSFEIVDVAGEYMAIPVGKLADSFGGIVTLSETAAFLLKNMKTEKTVDELAHLLSQEYDIDEKKAFDEVSKAIVLFGNLSLIEDK